MATFVTGAYRLPLQAPLILFSGLAVVAIKEIILQKEWKKLQLASLILLVLFCITHYESPLPKHLYNRGAQAMIDKYNKFHELEKMLTAGKDSRQKKAVGASIDKNNRIKKLRQLLSPQENSTNNL